MKLSPKAFWKPVAVLFASGLTLVGGREFHANHLLPLWREEATAQVETEELRTWIERARPQIAEVIKLDLAAKEPRRVLKRMQNENPPGSPTQWMPNLLTARFARPDSGPLPTRLHTVQEAANVDGHQRGFWSTAFPLGTSEGKIAGLLESVADLEQQHPSVRVVDLTAQPDPANGGAVTASINYAVLIPE